MTTAQKIIAFDVYGTLLSTESIVHELAKLYGDDKALVLAAKWRQYQLEYTWRINCMGEYKDFSEITRGALRHALSEQWLEIAQLEFDHLMTAYDRLHVFDEVPAALERLAQQQQQPSAVTACLFSNGTDAMVRNSIAQAEGLRPHVDVFRDIVTVEEVRAFKPDRRVYEHLLQRLGRQDDHAHARADVWVVSANPFDIVGAKAAGLKAAFIDRAGTGWVDRLDSLREPSLIAPDVDEAVRSILEW